jgi:hypothetical protein
MLFFVSQNAKEQPKPVDQQFEGWRSQTPVAPNIKRSPRAKTTTTKDVARIIRKKYFASRAIFFKERMHSADRGQVKSAATAGRDWTDSDANCRWRFRRCGYRRDCPQSDEEESEENRHRWRSSLGERDSVRIDR